MKKIAKELAFFAVSATVILPAPILLLAWMTGQTIQQVLYR
jgi:hypothetical protein